MAFIGRERELAALGAALQRAAHGELSHVAIRAPLGGGASRLLDELVARLAQVDQVNVWRTVCHPAQAGVAYAAIRRAISAALAALPDERLATIIGPATHDIIALLPEIGPRLGDAGAPAEPQLEAPEQRGARVREALLGVVERLAGERQICLVIEDLEHGDPGTHEFVRMLLRLRRPMRLTVVVAFHPDQLERGHRVRGLVRELGQRRDVEQIELEPLGRDELFDLVESLETERPTLAFMAAVMEGSRGNPLLAQQLVDAHRRLGGTRLSDPLDEIVHARLDQMERQSVRAVRLLAAARRPLSASELATLRLGDGPIGKATLAAALDSGLVTGHDDGSMSMHELLAEAVELAALPADRHAKHAELAVLTGAEPAEAAWHWSLAMRPAQARSAFLEAAERAQPVEPGSTTLLNYSAALELEPDAHEDVAVLAAAAQAAHASGAFRRAVTLAEQALERLAGGRIERLLASRSDPALHEQAALLSDDLGRYRRASGDLVGAREAIEQAVSLAPTDAPRVRASVLGALAQDLMLEGRFADSAVQAEQARQAALAAQPPAMAEFAHATDTLAVDLGFEGRINPALALLDEAIDAARQSGRLDEVIRCYANRTTLLDLDTRRDEALAVVKQGISEASRNGLGLTFGAFLRGNAADILFQLGRWRESEAECRAALQFPPAGVAWFSPILYLGLVLVESRADDEAARLVGQTLLQLETVPAGQWSAIVLRSAVSLALWRGEIDDALAAAERGWSRVLETADPSQLANSAATVLEACAAAAERGRARRDWSAVANAGSLAARVMPAAEEHMRGYRLPATVGARREAELYMATARAHAERVRGKSAPEEWAGLAEAWAKVPVPYNSAKARWWQAQAALPTRARRAEARRALSEASRIAARLPAAPLQRALAELAERARIRLPEGQLVAIPIERDIVAVGPGLPASHGDRSGQPLDLAGLMGSTNAAPAVSRFGLSPRENAVLLVLAEGRTNREIAERLFISERTVAVHVRRILSKLAVSGRVEAAGLAIRLGLVPDDPRTAVSARSAGG